MQRIVWAYPDQPNNEMVDSAAVELVLEEAFAGSVDAEHERDLASEFGVALYPQTDDHIQTVPNIRSRAMPPSGMMLRRTNFTGSCEAICALKTCFLFAESFFSGNSTGQFG